MKDVKWVNSTEYLTAEGSKREKCAMPGHFVPKQAHRDYATGCRVAERVRAGHVRHRTKLKICSLL